MRTTNDNPYTTEKIGTKFSYSLHNVTIICQRNLILNLLRGRRGFPILKQICNIFYRGQNLTQVYVSNTDQRRVPASRFEIDPKDMVILCIWDMTSTVCKDISRNNEMNLGEKNVSRRERHLISCFLVFLGNVKDILWSIHVRQSSM